MSTVLPQLFEPKHAAIVRPECLDTLRHAALGMVYLSRLVPAIEAASEAALDDGSAEPASGWQIGCLQSAMIALSEAMLDRLGGLGDAPAPSWQVSELWRKVETTADKRAG